jgi:hypothetical protein
MRLSLKLAPGQPVVARIDAQSPTSGGVVVVKATDADAKTITVAVGGRELTLAVAADVQVASNAAGRGDLTDLTPGMRASLTLGVEKDRFVVKRILGKKDGG